MSARTGHQMSCEMIDENRVIPTVTDLGGIGVPEGISSGIVSRV